MLPALILLGLLPLAALPMLQGSEEADVVPDDPESPAETAGDGPENDEGTVYSVAAQPDSTLIESFRPGIDSVELDLTGGNGEIHFETSHSPDGATLALSLNDASVATVAFSGLAEVPSGDIFLRLLDDESGEVYDLALSDAILEGESGPLSSALDPLDPEGPDGVGTLQPADPLDPVDPEQPDVAGPSDPGATVLDPLDPNAEDPPAPGAAPLEPLDPEAPEIAPEDEAGLQSLLQRDSDNLGGAAAAALEADATGTVLTTLGPQDDAAVLPDDGVADNAALRLEEGTAVLTSDHPVDVIDGGAGDDRIDTGDESAFVFGGPRDDTLTSGDGAAALYGGDGADVLQAGTSTTAVAYLDGGAGNDTLTGGSGGDILEGGEHVAGTTPGDDLLDGGAGDDTLRGGLGADTLLGGAGDDVLDHAGHRLEREGVARHEFDWHVDDAPDSLDGGAGDDTLILGDGDVATGGTGNDLFWVYDTGAAAAPAAEITDFQVGEDFLRVSLNPQNGQNGAPEVSVEASADGSDGLVRINGDLVAILRGAPGATASDIYAEVRPDVF